jgi:hypothetical protein
MEMMRNFIFGILLWAFTSASFCQTSDSCFYVQVDLANRWVWRGVSYSEAPVIQPMFGFTNTKWNALIFGSYPFERRAYSEIDFTVEYLVMPQLKIGLTDYFAINDSLGAKHAFFNFDRKTSSHMLDIYALASPFKNIPLSLLASFWFWGADRNAETLEQNFSTYLELKYEQTIKSVKASAFIGGSPFAGFYSNGPAVVNMGIGITKPLFGETRHAVPAKIEFVLNPYLQNVYVNAIISIK